MTPPKSPAKDPVAKSAAETLARRRARAEAGLAPSEITDEDRAIALAMRDRDHSEGCPMVPGRQEAYESNVVAPGPELRNRGVRPGDSVVVVRCHDCGQVRYPDGYSTRDDLIDANLAVLAGVEAPVDEEALDTTLS